MEQDNPSSFKDSTKLTKWTIRILYAQIVIIVIALISGVLEFQLLSDFKNEVYISQSQAVADGEASDTRQGVIGILQSIVFIVTGILILKWIHRANFNARHLGASKMEFTPGWSIGWYFIPFANLWKPYQAMKEIWKASSNPQDWNPQPTPSLLRWWWFFWIASQILSNAAFRLTIRANEIDELIVANVCTLVSEVTDLPLCFIVLAMIKRVHELQVAHQSNQDSYTAPATGF
jgi:Domain of unknown function (DUF4328)